MIANLNLLVGEDRPEWHSRAACRGMLQAFTSATLDEQVDVCMGTTSPWSSECPVRRECLHDFVETALEVTGMLDVYHNQLVHGGMKPNDLLRLCQRARRALADERKKDDRRGAPEDPERDPGGDEDR